MTGGIPGLSDVAGRPADAHDAVRELQLSEETCRALLAVAQDAMLVLDAAGLVLLCNPATERTFGHACADLVGKPLSLLLPDELDDWQERSAPAERPVEARQVLGLRKSGERFPAELSLARLSLGGRDVAVAAVRDLSERDRMERDLSQRTDELRERMKELRCLHACSVALAQAGEELDRALPAIAALIPDALQFSADAYARITIGDRVFAAGRVAPTSCRVRFDLRLAGEKAGEIEAGYTGASESRRFLPEEMDVLVTIARRLELSLQHARAEQALQQSERYFRSLIEQAMDLIAVVGADGITRFVSPSYVRLFGHDPDAVTGTSVYGRIHPDDAEMVRKAMREGIQVPNATRTLRFRLRRADGVYRVLEVIARNMLHDPIVRGIVVNGRDITDREALEAQLRQSQKIEAIGRLAGGVAHDFNNLLTAITGYSELALTGIKPGDPLTSDLKEIISAAKRASNLTRQLLAFSRKQVLSPKQLDVNVIVDGITPMLRRLVGEEIELRTVLGDDLGWVYADPGQFEQIILNLVMNARDAISGAGTIVVRTSLETMPHPGTSGAARPWVVLSVSDTGCGMDAATQAHLFEPFFTTKEAGKGTGLGLATLFGIVTQSGGHVSVDSEPGRGSTFAVFLPRADVNTPPQQESIPEPARGGNETILVVEDEEAVRRVVQSVLEKRGYRVVEAADADDALSVLAHRKDVRLLLTDVFMPGLSGIDLAARVTRERPDILVLFMSGYAERMLQSRLPAHMPYLPKPFTPDQLLRRVRELLDMVEASPPIVGGSASV